MQTLTYTIGSNRRSLVSDVQNFTINWSNEPNYNWVQARQYEKSMRQVFVNVKNEDGTPFDLTGANIWFEGLLPDGTHRVLDAKNGTILEPTNGQFRFDFPAQAFSVAGSYKQAFFRIVRDGMSVTTLEFDLEVLADKVITGLVPTDYITPFEELYSSLEEILNNADGDLHAKLDAWTTEYTAKVQELTALGTSVTNSLTSVQNRLAALETKIEEDGLFTKGEGEEFLENVKAEVLDAVKNEFYFRQDVSQQAIDFVQQFSDDDFNLTVITDSHFQEYRPVDPVREYVDYKNAGLALQHYSDFLTLADASDFSIALGDNTNGYFKEKEQTIADLKLITDIVAQNDSGRKIAITIGNHDDGSPRTHTLQLDANNALTDDEMKSILMTRDLRMGETRQNGSLYFFKDFEKPKIRLIVLNSEDAPETVTSNGKLMYPRFLNHGFRQQQAEWLATQALKTVPAGYHVVFMAHAPLNGNGWTDNDSNAHYYNNDVVIRIISAYVNGQTTLISSNDELQGTPWYISNINADFSAKGAGIVVGWFNGHKHMEKITTTRSGATINMIQLLNDVLPNGQESLIGTSQEGALTTVAIDTENRTVKMLGFGRASNRQFEY